MSRIAVIAMFFMFSSFTSCQSVEWTDISGGQLAIIGSSHSPFPHPGRADGHTYDDSLYSFVEHYNDSSVAIFIPENFRNSEPTDLVFYFHGWGNSIQESIEKFRLLDQFSASHKNAIFIFPEGPKNAPDSFGGKLEEKGEFKSLVSDALIFLKSEKKIKSTKPGNIILSGHSGAYRVISYILNRGGLTDHISEVYLFDALYAQAENYLHWMEKFDGRFINLVTPNGGTRDDSVELLSDLEDWGIPYQSYEKNDVSLDEFAQAKIITVFTSLGHSEVIDPYFEQLLKTSELEDIP